MGKSYYVNEPDEDGTAIDPEFSYDTKEEAEDAASEDAIIVELDDYQGDIR